MNRTRCARPTVRLANERTPGAALRRQPGAHGGSLDRQGGPPPTRVSEPSDPNAPSRAKPRPAPPRDPDGLPELPPDYDRTLERGLDALGLSLPIQARAAIAAHVRLLLAWNAAVNLTAITDPGAVAVRHVLDSLTALPLVAGASSILDVGSGGGFPGLPLAAALPRARVTLVESVAKKAAFLEAAAVGAGLAGRVSVVQARAEAVAQPGLAHDTVEVVVARAVAGLAELVELAVALLIPGGRLVAWKQGDLTAELAAAARAGEVLGAGAPVVHEVLPERTGGVLAGLEGHVLVVVTKVRATPAGYPRDPAARRRRPW